MNYPKIFLNLMLFNSLVMQAGEKSSLGKHEQTKSLTFTKSVVIGGTVGAAEVLLPGQMLSYAMNQSVGKKPFVLRDSYKGFLANAGGQMPITALQKVVQVKGAAALEEARGVKLNDWQKASVSFLSGVSGAFVDTPSNAIQLYLQKEGNADKSLTKVCRELGLRGLGRGFATNALCKEGPFAVGYQWLAPKTSELLEPYTGDGMLSTALGGAIAGAAVAVVTQPGAVIRTKVQTDWGCEYKNSYVAAKEVYITGGSRGFFSGLPQRGARVFVAVPLYVGYTKLLEDQLKE